jgi:hypothetical protein
MSRFWAAEDLQIVRWLYPHVRTEKLAAILGRKISAVYAAGWNMGLHKTKEFLAGLRRPGYAPGRMAQTQFKKGCRTGKAAQNWCPIGTVRTDKGGFQRIKVREAKYGKEATGFGNTKVWPLLNRHVWEQHKGPVPPSHAICFRDGKRTNCAIENLECISRAELAQRNVMWTRYPRDLALAIQMNGALK